MASKAEIHSNLPIKIQATLKNFWGMSLIFFILMISFRLLELKLVFDAHVLPFKFEEVVIFSLLEDFSWYLYLVGLLLILHCILTIFSLRIAKWFSQLIFSLALLIQFALSFYFSKTLIPLGKDLFAYSSADLVLTLEASGQLNNTNLILIIAFFFVLLFLLQMGIWLIRLPLKAYFYISGFCYVFLLALLVNPLLNPNYSNETKQNIKLNKSSYLAFQTFDYFMFTNEYYFDFYLRSANEGLTVNKEYFDSSYPFAFKATYPDVLGPYFDSLEKAPDIVFVLIESLGKAYSGKDAYLGSFTPFLDSLEQHSLVWLNNISSTGRTFGILPGIFSGLPYGEKGFLELYQDFPKHESLLSVLKQNEYEIRYFIGADRNFDYQGNFLDYQQVDQLVDILGFDPKYEKAPSNTGFSWGYSDKELFRNGLEKLPTNSTRPQLRIFQTQTSHDPYIVPERATYQAKLRNHLRDNLGLNDAQTADYLSYEDIYMTLLYADDAVREFINAYSKRPEFENTIFVFTGDHRLPEIPMSSRLDRFHVPLIIYSPLLERTAYFRGMSSHFEVTPSILAFLRESTGLRIPEIVAWQGQVLDTARLFQAKLSMPLMRNKNQLLDYLDGEFLLSDGQLFKISDNLNIDPITDSDQTNKLNGQFEDFKNKNNYVLQTRKLLPDQTIIQ
jgi:phosphoglycerol transferase MdoB-like AlkP superfamily enzyme